MDTANPNPNGMRHVTAVESLLMPGVPVQMEGVFIPDEVPGGGMTAIAVRNLLATLGVDLSSEHFLETPRRVAAMYHEFFQPCDLVEILKDGFENRRALDDDEDPGALVVQIDIPFKGLCPHHLLPFFGTCDVAYIPDRVWVGLSKLTRVAQAAGTIAPRTQEEITNTICDALNDGLLPVGAMVITSAVHTCMAVRGVNAPQVKTRVSSLRGAFMTKPEARAEALSLMRSH